MIDANHGLQVAKVRSDGTNHQQRSQANEEPSPNQHEPHFIAPNSMGTSSFNNSGLVPGGKLNSPTSFN
jgi:hypothetical protein